MPCSTRCAWRARMVRISRTRVAAMVLTVALVTILAPLPRTHVEAQATATTINSSSGPVEWDHGVVVAGQVTNLGVQDVCPPGLCDNHDLNVVLPTPAATFYT